VNITKRPVYFTKCSVNLKEQYVNSTKRSAIFTERLVEFTG